MRREGELAAQGLPWFRRNPGILPRHYYNRCRLCEQGGAALLCKSVPGGKVRRRASLNEPRYEERGSGSESADKGSLDRSAHRFNARVVSLDCSEGEERQQSYRYRGPKCGPDIRH